MGELVRSFLSGLGVGGVGLTGGFGVFCTVLSSVEFWISSEKKLNQKSPARKSQENMSKIRQK